MHDFTNAVQNICKNIKFLTVA